MAVIIFFMVFVIFGYASFDPADEKLFIALQKKFHSRSECYKNMEKGSVSPWRRIGKSLFLQKGYSIAFRWPSHFPGNRSEALKGNTKGQHSIRINDQWRICFQWKADGAHKVQIIDYH